MKFLKVFIIIIIFSFYTYSGFSLEFNWDKVTELYNYNIEGGERFNVFTLCYIIPGQNDTGYTAQYELNRWFPPELDGNIFIIFDSPFRDNSIYRLSHDNSGNILMQGLNGESYRFIDVFSEMVSRRKRIQLYYAPDYLIPDFLKFSGFEDQGLMVSPVFLSPPLINFNGEDFNVPPIPPDHPLAKWDKHYNTYSNPPRVTDFGWELPIIVDIGRLYGLSDDEIKLMIAIRVWENGEQGYEFGVKKARGTNLVEQAHYAAGSIKRANGNIYALASRWAPTVGVSPSEAAANSAWLPGVIKIWNYLRNYTLEELLSYLDTH